MAYDVNELADAYREAMNVLHETGENLADRRREMAETKRQMLQIEDQYLPQRDGRNVEERDASLRALLAGDDEWGVLSARLRELEHLTAHDTALQERLRNELSLWKELLRWERTAVESQIAASREMATAGGWRQRVQHGSDASEPWRAAE